MLKLLFSGKNKTLRALFSIKHNVQQLHASRELSPEELSEPGDVAVTGELLKRVLLMEGLNQLRPNHMADTHFLQYVTGSASAASTLA